MKKTNGKVSGKKSASTIMTPSHPRWNAFVKELAAAIEAKGCDSVSCSLSRRLLGRMDDVDVRGSIDFFEDNGGFCDCEVLMNVDE